MKKIFLFLAAAGLALQSCEGPEGPQGEPGFSAEAEVFELQNVDFDFVDGEYSIYSTLTPNILDSDVILMYRMSGTIDASTPIWQQIPRTLFLEEGELDYDFDFSREDFTIYAGGTYDLATTPEFIDNQTFRIVIVPGYFSKGTKAVDFSDYNAVIKAYNIDDKNVKQLN
ncbi:MAG TPA: hypothetical protein VF676_04480 [Flavobacterium sp.]|jgi:hypothetical protein